MGWYCESLLGGSKLHTYSPLFKKKGFHEQGTQANWLLQTKSYLAYSQTAVKHGAAGKYKYTHCDSSYLH